MMTMTTMMTILDMMTLLNMMTKTQINDNHGVHDDLPDHMTREGYRLTKVNFVHVYPQIPLLWSNVRLLV